MIHNTKKYSTVALPHWSSAKRLSVRQSKILFRRHGNSNALKSPFKPRKNAIVVLNKSLIPTARRRNTLGYVV